MVKTFVNGQEVEKQQPKSAMNFDEIIKGVQTVATLEEENK
jgi:hypothetical protein